MRVPDMTSILSIVIFASPRILRAAEYARLRLTCPALRTACDELSRAIASNRPELRTLDGATTLRILELCDDYLERLDRFMTTPKRYGIFSRSNWWVTVYNAHLLLVAMMNARGDAWAVPYVLSARRDEMLELMKHGVEAYEFNPDTNVYFKILMQAHETLLKRLDAKNDKE
jgi:hypothetical protein